MKQLGGFWILFFLFWAIPFPMIMYYSGSEFFGGSSPVWALIWLGVSLLLWIGLLSRLFRLWILRKASNRAGLVALMQNGDVKSATITASVPAPEEVQGVNKYNLTFSLQNFVGTPVHDTLSINDSHPELHHYEVGKTIKLRIDKTLQNNPYIQIDGAHYNPPTSRNLIIGSVYWLIVVILVIGYYAYTYQHESNGMGWRFIVWYHPLMLCPVLIRVVSIFFTGRKYTQNQLKHKYWGYRTEAQLLNAAQTGVYINEQPQVKFDLQYTDHKGQQHQASFKKVISLLDVNITKEKTLDIFYLDDEPGNVCLASEIENN